MTTKAVKNEKIIAQGKAIYETQISHLVEPQEYGKYLVLHVVTGDYAIGRDLGIVTEELLCRHPGATLEDVHSVRVGFPALIRMPSIRKIRYGAGDDSRQS